MLYIITPCSRPQNLETISNSIPNKSSWIVVHDYKYIMPDIPNATFLKCDDTGLVGTKARNFALDTIKFNDDDNIIHPKLYQTIEPLLTNNFSIMTWGQLHKNNSIRLPSQVKPKVGNIDTASFLISWKYNKLTRHRTDIYEHDGLYAEECANNGPMLCINDYLCYYNYLR